MSNIFLDSLITKSTEDEESGTLTLIGMANTTDKDRGCDIIEASAWRKKAALANYRKNPIVLAFHDHSQPIGTTVKLIPTEEGLEVHVEITKAAGHIYELVKANVLRAFSIGAGIIDASWDDDTETYIITELELYEISIVSVPMNQNSTFEVAKSLNSQDFLEFKKAFGGKATPPATEKSLLEKLALELSIIKE